MAPTRTVKSKHLKASPGAKRSSSSSTPSSKTGAAKSSSRSGPKSGVSNSTRRKATHGASTTSRKKKQRVYTAKELGVPRLNTVTPVGVQAPRGKKKGKVFVDSGESMMTILAMVNADKEGQIESKMMKARQMEEIREARKKEAEARQEERKSKFEDTKDSMRKRRKRRSDHTQDDAVGATADGSATSRGSKLKKRVSFA